ncbi:MAG: tRNA-dihydrouridine synthase family protein [Clostridia bacterium]|nr:tRNA-dihydrouridine synthase family protein [Clostridia bacterium]
MKIYFAPLEGVTDSLFRNRHFARFTGVDKYFMPFVSPTMKLKFTSKEHRELSPEVNGDTPVVPQILCNKAEPFLWMAEGLAEAGYKEINLNLGCPSGTVTAKYKGSGMLRDLSTLRATLDEIFAKSPIPISVKTRVGYESADQWPVIRALLAEYPIHELIVHPRARSEFYTGPVHRECIEPGMVYNGDIFTPADYDTLMTQCEGVSAVMIGRGLLTNPALARTLKGGAPLTKAELRAFHDDIYRAYCENWPDKAILGHMHEIAYYFTHCFESPEKAAKLIRKATTVPRYLEAVDVLFATCALKDVPAFVPPKGKSF